MNISNKNGTQNNMWLSSSLPAVQTLITRLLLLSADQGNLDKRETVKGHQIIIKWNNINIG